MSDKTGVRRGGLGRGLGALIPTGPLPGAAGKGHFWNALDKPPITEADLDEETAPSAAADDPAQDDSSLTGRHHLEAIRAESERSDTHAEALEDRGGDSGSAVDQSVSPVEVASGDLLATTDAPGEGQFGAEGDSSDGDSGAGDSDISVEAALHANLGDDGRQSDDPASQAGEPAVPSAYPQVVDDVPEETAGQEDRLVDIPRSAVAVDNADRDPEPLTAGSPDSALEPVTADVAVMIDVPVGSIHPNPKQPRQVFDDENIAELAHSIREVGLLQPVVVRRTSVPDSYELVMGERRLRAAKLAGLESVAVILRQTADEAMLRDALLENIHRVQLNPLEEAAAYEQLLAEFDVTQEELASRIGRSRSQISNTIRLLKLPVRVQHRLAAGVLSAGHARALLSLDSADDQDALATRIVAEGMSVRATEEAVSTHSGSDSIRRSGQRRRNVSAPALAELAERLSNSFDTRVLVQLGRRKGKVVIEFASIDDLERIIATMSPQLATRSRDETPPGRASQLDDGDFDSGDLTYSAPERPAVTDRLSDAPI